jgi:hypothetical protein
MKKTRLILICLIVFIFSLFGCTKQYDYNFEELVNSAEEIYIVDIEREEYYGDISIDYLMKIENEFENFLTDLTSLKFEYSILLSPQNNTGINIMVVCNSEKYDYVIIGLRGIEEFKNNEQTYLHNAMCNEEDFNEILNKYYK